MQTRVSAGRRRLTLTEVLVVIAIVAVLPGLLAPAVHTGRESSWLSACSNTIRQASLDVMGFESIRRRFPSAHADPIEYQLMPRNGGNYRRHGFIPLILPYMEEVRLYDHSAPWLQERAGWYDSVQPGMSRGHPHFDCGV